MLLLVYEFWFAFSFSAYGDNNGLLFIFLVFICGSLDAVSIRVLVAYKKCYIHVSHELSNYGFVNN